MQFDLFDGPNPRPSYDFTHGTNILIYNSSSVTQSVLSNSVKIVKYNNIHIENKL